MITFGYWVRRRRKALDLTQHALAERVGCSVVTVKKIEADARRASLPMAERLADVLAVPSGDRATFLARARGLWPADQDLPASDPAAPLLLGTVAPLPVESTPFFGRAAELQQLATLLARPDCRLLTLVGPGGVGKTRLGLRAAAAARPAHGVCFVPLGDITTGVQAAPSVATRLGLPRVATQSPEHALVAFLRTRDVLLLLDSVEHLLAGDQDTPEGVLSMIARILDACPRVKLLVTSRERLKLQAEWVFPVAGLAVEEGARALFESRAQRVHPAFNAQAEESHIDALCRLVEGMPLAIELAASWTPVWSCAQIKQQLEQDLDVLATRLRDVPARHRSLRAVFDRSWTLLANEQRRLLAALSVFRGGFTTEMMVAVCGGQVETLLALIDASLVASDGAGRYQLHELARRYAAEQLRAAGADAAVRRDHGAAYVQLAEEAAAHFAQASALSWLRRLDDEYDNLRAALAWALEDAEPPTLYRLALPLTRYWYARGTWHDGIASLHAILERTAGVVAPHRALCLSWYAMMLIRSGRPDLAQPQVIEAYALAQQVADDTALGWASLGMGYFVRDEPLRWCRSAVGHFERAGDAEGRATALYFLGDELRMLGQLEAARQAYDESWQAYQQMGNRVFGAYPLGNLGRIALLEGDVQTARRSFAACVAYSRQNGNRISLVDWLTRLGTVLLYESDMTAARAVLREARGLAQQVGYHDSLPTIARWLALTESLDGSDATALDELAQSVDGYAPNERSDDAHGAQVLVDQHGAELIESLVVVAQLGVARGQPGQAVIALGGAARLLEQSGERLDQPMEALMDGVLARCRHAMDAPAFREYWQQGAAHSGTPLRLIESCLHAVGS